MRFRDFLGMLPALLCLTLTAAPPRPGQGEVSSCRVMVLGDVHFDDTAFHKTSPASESRKKERDRNLAMWQSRSPALFAAAGKCAEAEQAAFAVQLGDLVQGDCDDAKLQGEMIRKAFETVKGNFSDIPLLIVKGNHDIRTLDNARDNAAANEAELPLISRELGVKVSKNACYAFMRGRDLFLAADGFIGAKALEKFVKKTLEAHPDTRYVFFMTHLPLMPASTGSPFWVVPGHTKIAEMLETRNALVLAAHTHAPSLVTRTTERGKLTQLIVSSMGNAWTPVPGKGKIDDWAGYAAAVEKSIPEAKDPEKTRKQWTEWKNSGEFTFRHLFRNSGFAVLSIDDERVVMRYYTDSSGVPAVAQTLLTGR